MLSRQPDYILNTYAALYPVPLADAPRKQKEVFFPRWSSSEREMVATPEFWNRYHMRSVALAGRFLNGYERSPDEIRATGPE